MSGLASQSTLLDSQKFVYESNLYILFTNVSYNKGSLTEDLDDGLKTLITTPKPKSSGLIEHHLGVMLASPDLPDLYGLRHIVDDCSDDLGDILNALEHAVE